MRLPSRIVLGATFFAIAAAVHGQQAPPQKTSPPVVSGKKTITSPQPQEVTRVEPAEAIVSENAPQPLGFEADVYCFGYLGGLSESFPFHVQGAENSAEQVDYVAGDLVYLDGGADRGLKVGDEYWIVTSQQEVFHPVSQRSMGRFYQYRGRAVVQTVLGRTGIAKVTNSCTDIPLGSALKPFEPVPIPLARKSPPATAGDPPSGKPRGHIVFSREGLVALGTGDVVIVDVGLASGVSPGDFVTIYRYAWAEEFGIHPIGTYWVSHGPPPGVEVPRTYLGEAAILMVGDRWAVARITDAFRLIGVQDEIELK